MGRALGKSKRRLLPWGDLILNKLLLRRREVGTRAGQDEN
jgi:hypothetical protein